MTNKELMKINAKDAYWYPASILRNTVAYSQICRYLERFDLDSKDLFEVNIPVVPPLAINSEPKENPSFTDYRDYIMTINLSVFNNYRLDGEYSQFEEIALAFTRLFFNKHSDCTMSI
jgi:hypothetical protein